MPVRERIGIDLGGTKIEAVLLDRDDTVAWRKRVPTPREYDGTVAAVLALVAEADRRTESPAPVGIGTPGAWVPATRTMKNCNSTWLKRPPFAR